MKLITPEISWHQKEPIFSVDFCPKTWKLASCGADFTVKIWMVNQKEDADSTIGIEFLANLDRHAKPVNVVRFSPDGKYLASAGDDGAIILWKLNENERLFEGDLFDDNDIVNKETWIVHKMLRGHTEDVYDLAWSPDSTQLISGSVDNSAILWDAIKGQNLKILTDHKHYIQGVCWDPRGYYIATHSSDRSCRLYHAQKYKCLHNIHKNQSSYKQGDKLIKSKLSKMFVDETMQSFFRRCTFSPDGSFLFLPAGLCDGEKKSKKTTFVFARGHFKCPVQQLSGPKKATVAVKCSPIVYELKEDKENSLLFKENSVFFKLPYRMIYAVASLDAVTFYDTQHDHPIGHCANMHYASLTDMTWSSDGKLLVVSSTDGYCSFIKFDDKELGTPILYDSIEYQVAQAKICAAASKTKKKEKQDSKKNEESESIISEHCENQNVITTPSRSNEVKKEKNTDRNQPTIEKLFVTPVRKRKRLSEASPTSSGKRTPSIAQESDTSSPAPNRTDDTHEPTAHLSRQSTDLKTPLKRAQATTLSTAVDPKSTPSITSISPAKPPKRVSVTTLMTFTPEETAAAAYSTNAVPSISSTPETPKRVPVTPLSTVKIETPKVSGKTPKRVSVTTLSTFNTSNNKLSGILDLSCDDTVKKSVSNINQSINGSTSNNSTLNNISPQSKSEEKSPKKVQTITSLFSKTSRAETSAKKEASQKNFDKEEKVETIRID